MEIIGKNAFYKQRTPKKTIYKATFTTKEGVIHRVDFDKEGRIDNLCEYTAHNPDILVEDLKELIENIEKVVQKEEI